MDLLESALSLLFPPRCLCCNQVVEPGEDCCRECRRTYPLFPPPGDWEGRPVVSVWTYLDQYPVAIRRLKFQRDYPAGKRIARLMAKQWKRQRPWQGKELITFVPMPPERERRRGGNQAELLARWIGKELGCPVEGVLRREGILTQHQLPAAARHRQENPMGLLPGAEAIIAGRRVVLVDDLVTTGATAGACIRLLEAAGAKQAAILVATRAAAG